MTISLPVTEALYFVLGAAASLVALVVTAAITHWLEVIRLHRMELGYLRERVQELEKSLQKVQKQDTEAEPRESESKCYTIFLMPMLCTGLVSFLITISEQAFQWITTTTFWELIGGIATSYVMFIIFSIQGGLFAALKFICVYGLLLALHVTILIGFVKLTQTIDSENILQFWQTLFAVDLAGIPLAGWYVFRRQSRLKRLITVMAAR